MQAVCPRQLAVSRPSGLPKRCAKSGNGCHASTGLTRLKPDELSAWPVGPRERAKSREGSVAGWRRGRIVSGRRHRDLERVDVGSAKHARVADRPIGGVATDELDGARHAARRVAAWPHAHAARCGAADCAIGTCGIGGVSRGCHMHRAHRLLYCATVGLAKMQGCLIFCARGQGRREERVGEVCHHCSNSAEQQVSSQSWGCEESSSASCALFASSSVAS